MNDRSEESASFNLVDEAWVPVIWGNGTAGEVGLRELFERAPDIREITGDCPQQSIVLIRLALAILYRAYFETGLAESELDEMWLEIWQQGNFDQDTINEYLQKYHDAFDLFGERPFMQVAGLEYQSEREMSPVSELVADVPKPDKFLFSMRDRESLGELTFPQAARWLLFAQAYDIAGTKTPVKGNTSIKKGKVYPPKGLCGTGLLGSMEGVYVQRRNLFETLMLNWTLHDSARAGNTSLYGNPDDTASWEDENETSADMCIREPAGPASVFTWQSRRMKLVADQEQQAVIGLIICYGDITSLMDKQAIETMCAWQQSKKKQKELGTAHIPWVPTQPSSSKALWRGLASLLAIDETGVDMRAGVIRWAEHVAEALYDCTDTELDTLSIHVQGMTYIQKSAFDDSINDYLDIAAVLLRHDSPAVSGSIEVVGQSEKAVWFLKRFAGNLEEAAGNKRKGDSQTTWENTIAEQAYDELDGIFRNRIAGFSEHESVNEYCDAWREEVHRVLLRMGNELVAKTGAKQFGTHGAYAIASAKSTFQHNLDATLGTLSATNSEAKEAR